MKRERVTLSCGCNLFISKDGDYAKLDQVITSCGGSPLAHITEVSEITGRWAFCYDSKENDYILSDNEMGIIKKWKLLLYLAAVKFAA